ncbi:MAG: RNA polymerase sigma factor [Spirochaetaceae bacterium]|nr:RNA polymerase sigma factor [Spirochaetaceae bacterium]
MLSVDEKHDDSDFRAIYEENCDMLLRVAYRITNSTEAAEDVVHDAFGKMLQNHMAFPSHADAKYWLIRVVKNAAINYAKRKGRETRAYEKWWRSEGKPIENTEAGSISLMETGSDAGVQDSAEEDLLKKESAEEVKKALDALPDRLKMVLILKEYSGMNYREIGKVLGITEGNVKVRAYRARCALLESLKREDDHVSR